MGISSLCLFTILRFLWDKAFPNRMRMVLAIAEIFVFLHRFKNIIMVIDFDRIAEEHIEGFKGGDGRLDMRAYVVLP